MNPPTEQPADADPARWQMLIVLSVAELLGMSLWFAGSAVASELGHRWSLDSSAIGWLTSIVQLGFVVGTALSALLNLADIVPSRWYFASAALSAAAANAALAYCDTYLAALGLRFATGFFLAGVYPPAMKMAATWFRARRGLAIGTVVGALVIGKSTPYLVHAFPSASPTTVILVASAGAVCAALLIAATYRDGPFAFGARPFSLRLVGTVAANKEWRLATGGYLGHMFELYSFWTWIPAFAAASLAVTMPAERSSGTVSMIAFFAIAVGGSGSVWGGVAADKRGREWLVTVAMLASGSCAVLVPLAFGRATPLLAVIALIWGFFVVADSAQFSALVTESVPSHAVGTALTIQTSLGFLLTMVSIQLVPQLVKIAGWKWAFPMLALGPAFGVMSIRRLVQMRRRSKE
jgi:MFS family permease